MSILPRWWFAVIGIFLALWAGSLAVGIFEGRDAPILQVLLLAGTAVCVYFLYRQRST